MEPEKKQEGWERAVTAAGKTILLAIFVALGALVFSAIMWAIVYVWEQINAVG